MSKRDLMSRIPRDKCGDKKTAPGRKSPEPLYYPPMRPGCVPIRGQLSNKATDHYYRPPKGMALSSEYQSCEVPALRKTLNHRVPSVIVTEREIGNTWRDYIPSNRAKLDKVKYAKGLKKLGR